MQESLHIKVSPKFILMKTAIQIYFVILKKTLGTTGETAFGIVYIVSIAGHAFLNLNIKPYNYEKLNFWTLISFAMIAWSAILTVLGHLTKTNYIP